MSNLIFIDNPSDFCHWVIYPCENKGGLIAGGYPSPIPKYRKNHLDKLLQFKIDLWISLVEDKETEKYGDYRSYVKEYSKNPQFLSCPIPDKGVCRDSDIFEMVELAYTAVKNNKLVYVHCWGGHGRCGVFSSCFLMRCYGWNSEKAIECNKFLHSTRDKKSWLPSPYGERQYSQIRRYRIPITVVVSGDRDSSSAYRKIITKELKNLPPKSTVIHGACRGIDTIAGEIATDLGLFVKEYPITSEDWRDLGNSAGPMRNRMMLDANPNYVLAFHPDIIYSRGTKDMMRQAYKRGIEVWYFDLKTKKKFKGDFKDM